MGSGGSSWKVTDDLETFRLDNLESEIAEGACCLSPSTPFVPSNLSSIYVFQLEIHFCEDWANEYSWFFSQQHPQFFFFFLSLSRCLLGTNQPLYNGRCQLAAEITPPKPALRMDVSRSQKTLVATNEMFKRHC